MRVNEKLNYWMYQEDVFEELKEDPYFQEYTWEQCQQDLFSLCFILCRRLWSRRTIDCPKSEATLWRTGKAVAISFRTLSKIFVWGRIGRGKVKKAWESKFVRTAGNKEEDARGKKSSLPGKYVGWISLIGSKYDMIIAIELFKIEVNSCK